MPRYDIGYRVADMLLRDVRDEPAEEDKVTWALSLFRGVRRGKSPGRSPHPAAATFSP